METLVFILAITNIVCAIALIIAIRIIRTQDERLIAEIRNNEKLLKLYNKLAREKKNGK